MSLRSILTNINFSINDADNHIHVLVCDVELTARIRKNDSSLGKSIGNARK